MSADLDTLLTHFLRERKYLRNLRPQTLEWYETAWKAFRKSATHCLTDPTALNRAHLEQFIYTLPHPGLAPCPPSHLRKPRGLDPRMVAELTPGMDDDFGLDDGAGRVRPRLGLIARLAEDARRRTGGVRLGAPPRAAPPRPPRSSSSKSDGVAKPPSSRTRTRAR